jgi:hypothetical protein
VWYALLAVLAGLVAGLLTRRWWSGPAVGAALTGSLSLMVADEQHLVWLPAYAGLGLLGSSLGWLARRGAPPTPARRESAAMEAGGGGRASHARSAGEEASVASDMSLPGRRTDADACGSGSSATMGA